MRPVSLGHRWLRRQPGISPPWTGNPWLNSSSSSLQLGLAIDETAQRQEQKTAIGIWEGEGGSVGTRYGEPR